MLLINEVSLGKCADCYKFDTELTAPPSGYSSVHGVRKTESIQSDFQVNQISFHFEFFLSFVKTNFSSHVRFFVQRNFFEYRVIIL